MSRCRSLLQVRHIVHSATGEFCQPQIDALKEVDDASRASEFALIELFIREVGPVQVARISEH